MQHCICDYCLDYSDITVLEALFLVFKMSLSLPSSGNGNTHESFIKARPPPVYPSSTTAVRNYQLMRREVIRRVRRQNDEKAMGVPFV